MFTSSVCQSLCAGVRCYMSGSEIRAEIGPGLVRGRYLLSGEMLMLDVPLMIDHKHHPVKTRTGKLSSF